MKTVSEKQVTNETGITLLTCNSMTEYNLYIDVRFSEHVKMLL